MVSRLALIAHGNASSSLSSGPGFEARKLKFGPTVQFLWSKFNSVGWVKVRPFTTDDILALKLGMVDVVQERMSERG
jgi:hypothetical protein